MHPRLVQVLVPRGWTAQVDGPHDDVRVVAVRLTPASLCWDIVSVPTLTVPDAIVAGVFAISDSRGLVAALRGLASATQGLTATQLVQLADWVIA